MNRTVRKILFPLAILGLLILEKFEDWSDRRAVRRYKKRVAKGQTS